MDVFGLRTNKGFDNDQEAKNRLFPIHTDAMGTRTKMRLIEWIFYILVTVRYFVV